MRGPSAISNTLVLTGRVLKHSTRSTDTIITVVIMPVAIMLAFVFVLGGAMKAVPGNYVDYVVPVVLLLAIASGVAYTSYHVNQDVTTGMFDRLRTMPIARAALVGGHIVASVVANAVTVIIVVCVAFLCGYRPHPGPLGGLLMVALLLVALIAFSVMGTAFGLAARSTDTASIYSYLLMGLLFVSSGFAPTETMPKGLAAFANYQPMTPILDAVRGAQSGQIDGGITLVAFVWLVVIVLVFAGYAVWAIRRSRRS